MRHNSVYLHKKAEFNRLVRKAIKAHEHDKITWDVIDNTAYLSDGNIKLVSDIKQEDGCTLFLIFNLPSRETCPFSTAHCREMCYACKAEQNYPDCLPCRKRNYEFTKNTIEFAAFMIRAIRYICNLKKYKNSKYITVRIHESGDFYSIDYMIAWFTIARFCRDIENLNFAVYSKSVQFYDMLYRNGYRKGNNFIFRYSIWDDTDVNDIMLAEKYHLPIYTAFETELPKGYYECKCENCGKCRTCFTGKKRIACKIH